MQKFIIGLLALMSTALGGFAVQQFGAFNPTGGNTYLLQSSISASQNTITLTSFTEPGSGIPYTMSYINTDILYGTIAPSSGSSEFVAITGITQNANGTATLTGVTRGLARTPGTGGCVASSTLARAFPGQTQFILSNSPCFYAEYAVKKNNENIRGQWTFYSTSTPHYLFNPSAAQWTTKASTTLASKGYVDDTVGAGCADASESTRGCVEIATALEAASSTVNGGTGAMLVPSTATATDTPSVVCNSTPCFVMTKYGRKTISQLFLDIFTTANTWVGGQIFSNATSTNATTTTFAVSGLGSGVLVKTKTAGAFTPAIAGIDYGYQKYTFSTSTDLTATNAYATSTPLGVIPAGVFNASSTIEVNGGVTGTDAGADGACIFYLRDAFGSTVLSGTLTAPVDSHTYYGGFHGQSLMDGSASAQNYFMWSATIAVGVVNANHAGSNPISEGTSAFPLASGISLRVVLQSTSADTACAINNYTIIVNP